MPMISDVKSCLFRDGILGCTILMGGLLSMKCVCFSISFAMIAYLFMCFVEYNSPPMTENRGACSTANMNGHGHDVSSFLNARKKKKKKKKKRSFKTEHSSTVSTVLVSEELG
jgi:hypothetical protein